MLVPQVIQHCGTGVVPPSIRTMRSELLETPSFRKFQRLRDVRARPPIGCSNAQTFSSSRCSSLLNGRQYTRRRSLRVGTPLHTLLDAPARFALSVTWPEATSTQR